MAEKEMYDYLAAVTADYTTTELSIIPHNIIVEAGEKTQFIHKFSDGQKGIVTLSSTSRFSVTLQWDILSRANEGTIVDLWHDENKANGIACSFYWQHPTDGHTYTVKFLEPLESNWAVNMINLKSINQIKLDILGYKA